VTYKGQIATDPNTGFAIFEDPESGRNALEGDINIKLKRGINTPHDFVEAYLGKDPKNTDQNKIDYKQHIANTLGLKDPHEPFPENSTSKIADAISGFESGSWKKPKPQQAEPADSEEGKTITGGDIKKDEAADADQGNKGNVPTVDPRSLPGTSTAYKQDIGTLGALTGAVSAGAVEAGSAIIPAKSNILAAMRIGSTDPNAPSTRWGLDSYTRKMFPMDTDIHLKDLESEVTKLRQAADPKAPKVKLRTMSEVQDAIKEIQAKAPSVVQKPVISPVPGSPGQFSDTGRFVVRDVPGTPGADLSAYVRNPNTPVKNAVMAPVKAAQRAVTGALPSALRIGTGALGGLNAATSGYDAWEMAHDPKYGGSSEQGNYYNPYVLGKGAQMVGGAMMMVPGMQLPGAALTAVGMAPEAYDLATEYGPKAYEYAKREAPKAVPRAREYLHRTLAPETQANLKRQYPDDTGNLGALP
jgi:hypothetical protein